MAATIPHFGLVKQYKNLKSELLDITDQVLSSGCLMDGPFTSKFEAWLEKKTGANYAITVHSGTQALEIIAGFYKNWLYLTATNNKPKVYIPNISYVATLNAFLNLGFEVELIDTDKNGLMSNELVDKLPKFSLICPIGLYGANPQIPQRTYSDIVVDGAQHWLVSQNSKIGFGMAISFDPTKNLNASGNGGAIITNNSLLYEYAMGYRNNGKRNNHKLSGTNSRMSELDSSHCLVKTKYIDKWQEKRKKIRYFYLEQFRNLPISCLSRDFTVHADQKFVIYTGKRDELYEFLTDNNIDIKIHYPYALSELEIAKHIKNKPDMISNSILLTKGTLSLPIYPELTDAEIEYISNTVRKFFDK